MRASSEFHSKDDFEDFKMQSSMLGYLISSKFLKKFKVVKLLDSRVEVLICGENMKSVVKIPQVLRDYDGEKCEGRAGLFKRENSTLVLVKITKIDSKKCVI